MIRKKQKNKKQKTKSKYFRIGKFKIKKKIAITIICVLVFLVTFIPFRTSDLWPWPSQDEIDQRLVDVIDGCIYNENSRACKNLQNKYNIVFEYCYALSDIPEINAPIPAYGVARLKSFTASSLNNQPISKGTTSDGKLNNATSDAYSLKIEAYGDSKYPYYSCVRSIDEISRQKGPSLISNPETIALFGLSKIPYYYETYEPHDGYGCTLHLASINNLWNQIPNIAAIRNEADNIFNMYPKCNMRASIDRALDGLNAIINNYANNYSVQLFYQKYDEWNTRDSRCTWYEKTFPQRCGAGSDGSADSAGYGNMLKDFAEEMYGYLHTRYFTSKIVLTN